MSVSSQHYLNIAACKYTPMETEILPLFCYYSCSDLYDYNMEVVDTLLTDPYPVLQEMDQALISAQFRVLDEFTTSQRQYMVCIH